MGGGGVNTYSIFYQQLSCPHRNSWVPKRVTRHLAQLSVTKPLTNSKYFQPQTPGNLKRVPEKISILKFTPVKSCSKYARRGARCSPLSPPSSTSPSSPSPFWHFRRFCQLHPLHFLRLLRLLRSPRLLCLLCPLVLLVPLVPFT
mgnify:CR=1 FL=1